MVKYSELNEERRIDAEYFEKKILTDFDLLRNFGTLKIGDIATVTDGIHTSIDYDEKSPVNLISATSPKENVFDLSRGAFISEKAHKENPRTALRKNDVIISTVGTIGNCAVVDDSILPANSDRHVGIIRINTNYSPYVLSTFLLSKYGKLQTLRESTGNVQLNLFIYKLKELYIPKFSDSFQSQIEQIVKSAHECLSKSKRLYSESEELLLSELDLKDWQPSNSAVNVKRLKESFLQTGRLDAEFYQPKYDEIESVITKYKNGCSTISECFSLNTEVCDYAECAYNYIEIGDINTGDGSASYNLIATEELPDNAKRVLHKDDVLVSKVRPYRGAVAIINFDTENLIASGAFTVLHEKSAYKKEVLQVLLRTQIYKDWLLKWNVGSSYPVIKDEDILSLPIPKIQQTVQSEIAGYVQKSISLRAEAKSLLESAKTQVEEYITAIHGGGYNDSVNSAYEKLIQESISCYRMAEWLLLAELYADLWKAQTAVCFSVKTFSDFQEAGRLDAEYYQPKYDELSEKLSHYDCKMLGEIVSVKKSVEPGSECYQDDGIPFVRVSDITEFGIEETDLHLSPKEFSLEALRPHKDTILLSKDGSVGIAYKCETDLDIITSGALLHLTVHDGNFLPDYVTLVLNSIAVKMQAERDSNGAIIQHWKPDDIKRVVIPCLALSVQKTITEKIQQSFALRAESKRLLKQAKRMVESEIEGGNW